MAKITRAASRVNQGDLVLYTTSLKVSDLLLPKFYSIEELDPENPNDKGYQRLLNKARAKKLADYIISGQDSKDAYLPTSIFLATTKKLDFSPDSNMLTIDLDEVGSFSIVDGQHRVEGLRMAAEKDSRVLDFEIPVNIGENLSKIAQMCHFLIVNTTQRSVDKGVEQQINARLTKMIDLEDIPTLPNWVQKTIQRGEDEKALGIVNYLNTSPESPWRNKVKMANQDDNTGSINQKSFVKSIKKFVLVSNNPISAFEQEMKQKIFLNYWKAIVNILGDEEPTVLFKYNGVDLFCRFSVPFFNRLVNQADYKVSTMQDLLQKTFDNMGGEYAGVGHTQFWVKGETAGGLNSGALSKINSEMSKSLHKSSTSGEVKI